MKNWWKYILAVLIGSIVCYQLTISLTPNVIYQGAKRKILNRTSTALNKLTVSEVITAEMRSVVMPNPDFIYLTAFYDLSDGPLQITGEMPDSTYWSVSMYYPNTVNWYVKNDMEFENNNLDLKIKYANPKASNTPGDFVHSDKEEGFILFRVLLTDRTDDKVKAMRSLLENVKLENI